MLNIVLTMDTKIKACRICLITDVKMHYIDNVLEDYISLLAQDESYRAFPNYICYECKFLLVKFVKFRKKYIIAQSVLSNMLKERDEVTEEEIKEGHDSTSSLKSCLDYQKIQPTSFTETSNNNVIEHEEFIPDRPHNSTARVIKPEVYIKPDFEEIKPYEEDQFGDTEDIKFNIEVEPYMDENDTANASPKYTFCNKRVKTEKLTPTTEKKREKHTDKMPFILEVVPIEAPKEKASSKSEVAQRAQKRKSQQPRKCAAPPPKKTRSQKRAKKNAQTTKSEEDDNLMSEYVTIVQLSTEEQLEELRKRQESSNYVNAPYQCNMCYRGFVHTHAWKHHLLKHDPSAGNVECPICKIRFKGKGFRNTHVKKIHEMKYMCKLCPVISSQKIQAKRHQRWHEGVTYKCKHCDEVCTKWTSYLGHMRIKHPSEFICDVCGYSFVSKLGLGMHKKMIHKRAAAAGQAENDVKSEPGPYCKDCDIKFATVEAWNRHMITSIKHKQTVHFENLCRVCGKTFESKEELRAHRKLEHKPLKNYASPNYKMTWPAKCELCSEELANGRQKWDHYQNVHPNEAYPHRWHHRFMCDICGKSFPSNAGLIYHKRTHSEERLFKCGTCGKGFFNRANLQTHETQTHSELRPYPCNLCTKAFKCKGALIRHSRSHTGAKPYPCSTCGKSFSQTTSRNLHVRTVHLKQPTPPRARRRTAPARAPDGELADTRHAMPLWTVTP